LQQHKSEAPFRESFKTHCHHLSFSQACPVSTT
jgi:hypothetical protein